MKLTKSDKSAFINAVMSDVPVINYSEKAQELMMDHIVKQMPTKVYLAWIDKECKPFISCNYYHRIGVYLPGFYGPEIIGNKKIPDDLKVKITKLDQLNGLQLTNLASLKELVTSLIAACSTLNYALENLTENYHKYLPANRDGIKTKNVPAVRDVTKALKEAGWPIKK